MISKREHAIGYTERGFGEYGRIVDAHGNTILIRESSSAEVNAVWLFCRNRNGEEAVSTGTGRSKVMVAVSPHLDQKAAEELIAALQRFIADAKEDEPKECGGEEE